MCIRDRSDTARLDRERVLAVCTELGGATAHSAILARALGCLLYTSDAADERSSVDLGGRRILKKKNQH